MFRSKRISMRKKLYIYSVIMFSILFYVSFIMISKYIMNASYSMTESYMQSELKWMENKIGKTDKWHIENDKLYNGKKLVGDGTGSCSEKTFYKLKTTDTIFRIYMKNGTDYLMVASSDYFGLNEKMTQKAAWKIRDNFTYTEKIKDGKDKSYRLYVPIHNKKGNVVGAMSAERNIYVVYKNVVSTMSLFVPIMLLLLLIAIFGLNLFMSKWLKTIKEITTYLNQIMDGHIPKQPLEITTNDEISDIVEGVNKLAVVMRKNEVLTNKSETDPLTQMGNRFRMERYFNDIYDRCVENNKPFAIEIIDVDFFKQFNDNYGHVAGDDCLKGIANILKNVAKNKGVYAIRYGGDEFIMLYEGFSKKEVKNFEKQIYDEVHKMAMPHEYSKVNNIVTVTQGAYYSNVIKGQRIGNLLKKADQVLYSVKEKSKDAYDIA